MSGQLMRKYLNETSLHGFAYAGDKNKFFVAFWALLTTACVLMAVRDITNLTQFARSDPTAFTFEVKSGDYQPLPTPTLCMEILVTPPDNITIEDVETDIQTFINARTISNISTTTTTTTTTIDPNWIAHWVDPSYNGERIMTDKLEYVTYMMLGYIADSELQLIGQQNQLLTDFATKYVVKPDDIVELIRAAYEAYRKHNFSLSDLKRLVGVSLCKKQFGKDVSNATKMYDHQQQHQVCEPATFTHLSFSLVCSKLFATDRYVRDTVTSQIRFINMLSATRAYYQDHILEFPLLTSVKFGPKCNSNVTIINERIVFPKFMWHVDLYGRASLPPNPSSDIVTFEAAQTTTNFELTITTEYQFYNRKLSPCLPPTGELQLECKRRKIVERLSQACKCWPSSFIDIPKPAAMPNCNDRASLDVSNISLSCSKINLTVDDVDCPKDCLRYTFDINPTESFAIEPPGWVYQWNYQVGRVHINFASDSLRSVITESPIMSFTIFACSFGGTIGTWLGGSLLAFIHIPIFFVANLTANMGKRKKAENVSTEKKEINNIAKEVIYPQVEVD